MPSGKSVSGTTTLVSARGILRYVPSAIILVMFFFLWEASVAAFNIPSFLIPAPSSIFAELLGTRVNWLEHTLFTTYETLAGFALAAVVGIATGYVIVHFRTISNIIYPYILAAQIVPKVAVAPLFFIWFGFGETPKILLSFLIAYFPIVIDTVVGLRAADPDLLDYMKLIDAKPHQVFFHVKWPNALPHIFGSFKVAMTLAIIGAVIGEFVGAQKGLGYMIVLAQQHFTTSIIFASLILLVVLGSLLYLAIELAEFLVTPWYRKMKRLS
ncbi:MAG: ABC transporter permease [Candidatus Caldarchaeum sp.]